jgi:hypothetical protein
MIERVPPIARVRLARSVLRLAAVPVVVGLAGAAAAAAGIVSGGVLGAGLAVLGGLVAVGAVTAGFVLLSIRLDVEESAIAVTWPGGGRRYALTPGPVTRVRLRGSTASRLRIRSGALGWGIGRARLRGEEEIELVRLAPTATAILVPTERGRLAIAPARDQDLLDALSRAARAREERGPLPEAAAARIPSAPSVAPVDVAPPEPDAPPIAMTGIERALLEERLARERANEEARAEAERIAAATLPDEGIADGAEPDTPTTELVLHPVRQQRRPRVRVAPPPGPRAVFVLLPTVGAALAWGAGLLLGRMPDPGTDLARLTSLALVMAGPATSVGAIMALAWWPRLVGVVVAGGLAAAVFIGRALLGAN